MKRIASLLLAVVIVIGMTATAFAANPKITKQTAALEDMDMGDVTPGTKIFLPFVKGAFEGATDDLTATDVRTSKITVKHTVKSGTKAIGSVEIKENSSKVAGVLITMAEPFTSTKPLDFELSVYLYIDGKRQSVGTVVTGTLCNDEQEVYSDTDYVDLSDGSMAVCVETAQKVEAFLGNGVSMFVRMVKGKNYMGVASVEPTDADIEVFDQYTEIVEVYNLAVNGLTGTGKFVKIDSGENLYAYDGELNYLGRTDEMLPFSAKYYIAMNKLDVIEPSDDEEEIDDTDGIDEIEDPDDTEGFYPGDDENGMLPAVSGSKNKGGSNPDTGASPLFGLAVAAGLVSLAAMSLISHKKRK